MQEVYYAVMPLDEPSTVIVTITLPEIKDGAIAGTARDCLIGRSARVLLPATGGGFIDQILRRIY
jgi:hypothetical protein